MLSSFNHFHWVQSTRHRLWFSTKTCRFYWTKTYVNSVILILNLRWAPHTFSCICFSLKSNSIWGWGSRCLHTFSFCTNYMLRATTCDALIVLSDFKTEVHLHTVDGNVKRACSRILNWRVLNLAACRNAYEDIHGYIVPNVSYLCDIYYFFYALRWNKRIFPCSSIFFTTVKCLCLTVF